MQNTEAYAAALTLAIAVGPQQGQAKGGVELTPPLGLGGLSVSLLLQKDERKDYVDV